MSRQQIKVFKSWLAEVANSPWQTNFKRMQRILDELQLAEAHSMGLEATIKALQDQIRRGEGGGQAVEEV